MINTLLKDRIIIISVIISGWGKSTETEGTEQRARVEDFNRLILDANGKEAYGQYCIICKANLSVKYGDKLMVTKKMGVDVTNATKEYQIIKIHKAEGFRTTHTEIYI